MSFVRSPGGRDRRSPRDARSNAVVEDEDAEADGRTGQLNAGGNRFPPRREAAVRMPLENRGMEVSLGREA